MAERFDIVVVGKPTGKARPRFVRATGRTFTPKDTQLAENEVRRAWEGAGGVRLDGPIRLVVVLTVERPQGHFKRDGSLSTEGLRHALPAKKPDVDNALKLVMDALNTRAWKDDVQVVQAGVRREWGEAAQTRITAIQLTPAAEGKPA